MKLPRKKRGETSAALVQTMWLILACSAVCALTAFGTPPAWWSSRGAVQAPQITTNNGVVTTNYAPNDYAVVTQGQLKQFTARAVDELNANLSGGAGTNLNNMVQGWAQDYSTNGYTAFNRKPSDYRIMTVGQLKYIGNQVWGQLVAGGYTNAVPGWLAQNTNSDNALADLGQLKTVFDFDLSKAPTTPPTINSAPAVIALAGSPVAYQITASGNPSQFSVTNLPSGLTFNSSTGVLSGTVATSGVYTIGINATNGLGTGSTTLTLAVNSDDQSGELAPMITSSLADSGTAGQTYSYGITASNSPTVYGAIGLPDGLTFNTATGIISGTPTSGGNYFILITATNAVGSISSFLNLTVGYATPAITSSATASASADLPFSYDIAANNSPISYSASPLPAGLVFDTQTGLISGTPTGIGTFTISLGATNSSGTGSATLTLTVSPQGPPVITSPSIAYATSGQSFIYNMAASGGPSSFGATGLPAGLTLDATTGVISGTPSAVGTPNVVLTASNASGQGSALLIIVVQATTGTAPATMTLQAGVSPSVTYMTTSAGIASDTSDPTVATGPVGALLVGASSSTQVNRALLGFDLSAVPTGATITSATLTLQGISSSAFTVELHQASGPFVPEVANWTDNGSYQSTLLSSLGVAVGSGPEIWSFPHDVLYTVQNVVTNGGPLNLMLVSPDGESSVTSENPECLTLSDEETELPTDHPALTITYTTSAPPVVTGGSTPLAVISGSAFSYPVQALNGATSYSASGLPSGLALDSSTGIISGTSTEPGIYTFTVTATNANGTGTSTLTLNVGSPPAITSALAAIAANNSSFNYTITASNTTGLSPVYSASNLPFGLTLDPTTGIISGVPTEGGDPTTVIFGVTTIYGTVTANLVITFPPEIAGALLTATGNVNDAFSYQVPSVNSPTTFTVSPSDGLSALGLSINSAGLITGTPTTTTSATGNQITVTASNSAGSSSVPLNLTILPLPVPTIPAQSLVGVIGAAIGGSAGSYQVNASVATAANSSPMTPTSYTVAPPLPSGLTMDSNGVISGTPTGTLTSTTTYSVTITASDAAGSGSGVLVITVYPSGPGIEGPLTANVEVGQNFSYEVQPVLSDAWYISATGLPPGLNFEDNNGIDVDEGTISGTLTTPGTYNVILSATDGTGTSTATLVLTVGSITSASSATAQVGVPFSFSVTDNNSPTDFQASNLPQGLSLNSTTGVISGTPVAANAVPVTLTVTDAGGSTGGTLFLTITANPNDSSLSFQQGVSPAANYAVPSATISADTQNAAIASQTSGSASLLTVGQTTATAYSRALLGFDLSVLPANATITSASLVMMTSSGNSSGQPLTVELRQSFAPVVPASATWNNNNSYNAAILDSLSIDPAATTACNTFLLNPTFTQAVQQAYNTSGQIYLTLLAPSVEQGGIPDYIGFVTNATDPTQNPKLSVTYTVTTPVAPVITSPSTAIGTVNSAFNYTITASNNPQTFSALGLPSGLTLDTSTGTISGTVTTVGSTVATVGASNSAGNGSQTVTFNIDSATPATTLQVFSGNNLAGPPGTFLPQALVVQADYNGVPLPNALVTFTVPAGEGAFALSNTGALPTANTLSVVTATNGQATVYYLLPQTLRTVTIVASGGTAQPVNFTETSTLTASGTSDPIALLSVISGEGQSGPAGQTLPQPFVVQATSASGQPMNAQSLSLTVMQGGGGISSSAGGSFASSLSATTDSSGQALIYLQPGTGNGGNNQVSCVASAGGSPVVYLTAQAISSTNSTPTPEGGSPPGTDPPLFPSTTGQPGNIQAWIVEADYDNGNVPSGPFGPDQTRINIHWSPTSGSGITGFLIEKKIHTHPIGDKHGATAH